MARFTNPAAFTNAFQNQVALGSQMRAADQDEQIRAGQINRANTINALGKDPNATAEQYVRAGDVQTGNALAGLEADKAQANQVAFPKVGMIAAQISGIADPAQKRAAFKAAILQNGALFDTMGMPHTEALAKIDASDDATLEQTIGALAKFAPAAAAQDVAPGHSLVRSDGRGGFSTSYTAPNEAKPDNPFGNIDPANYTAESVAKFQRSRNYGDLVAATKPAPQGQGFSQAQELRKEFNNQSSTFRGVADSYQRIVDSAKDPSPAGDLSLIFNYMKVLDPGSTVREGEFATAQNAGGVDDRVVGLYNRLMNGERLAPAQRSDFLNRGTRLYQGQEKRFNANVRDRYVGLAKRYGLDPAEITGEVSAKVPTSALPPQNEQGWTLHEDAQGNRAYVSPDGKQFSEVR